MFPRMRRSIPNAADCLRWVGSDVPGRPLRMDGMDQRIACPDWSVAGDVNPYLNVADCLPRPVGGQRT